MRAMILAAGLGTRLKPFTDKHPKALATVNGKPVLQRNIEYLQQSGIYDVIVNVHHFADQVINSIEQNNGWGSHVTVSNEQDEVLETGGGILKAAWYLKEAELSVVMNADILTDMPLANMMAYHKKERPLATLATSNRSTSRYLLFNKHHELTGWKNLKTSELKGIDGEPRAFSGIQILSPGIFSLFPFSGKFSMIDVYLSLCTNNRILSFDHSDAQLIDIGTQEKLDQANAMFP